MGTAGYQMPLESAHHRLIGARDDGSRPLNESNLLKLFLALGSVFLSTNFGHPKKLEKT